LFFLTSAISPPATEVAFNRVAIKLRGGTPDEAAIERGEKALVAPLQVIEQRLAANKWMLGAEFSLVDCDYGPTFNVLDKAAVNFADFPKTRAYLEAIRARQAWQDTPRLPGL
jgi:glutathione S-transferase